MRRPALFVYGTLRAGATAHGLMAGAPFIARVRIPSRLSLRGGAFYPAAWSPGRHAVVGECYRVSPLTLRRLDRFEQAPQLYRRRLIRTPVGWAWIYLQHDKRGHRSGRLLPQGDWMARQCRVTPGLRRSVWQPPMGAWRHD
jgi:gamma-glutamylcyclotransferase (GGCT)/AIG2-like uncharacterized protein YtfP